jgi:hypothetical protein
MLTVPGILLLAADVTQEIKHRVLGFLSHGEINFESV